MNKLHDIWSGGQLLAFSGIDGQTDFLNGLCLRTAMQGWTLELKKTKLDTQDAKIHYIGPQPEKVELTGDFFKFYASGKISCGVLADACNLLLDGEFSLEMTGDYEFVTEGNKILIASKGFLKKEFLSADLNALIEKRAKFVQNAPIPDGISEISRRTAVNRLRHAGALRTAGRTKTCGCGIRCFTASE